MSLRNILGLLKQLNRQTLLFLKTCQKSLIRPTVILAIQPYRQFSASLFASDRKQVNQSDKQPKLHSKEQSEDKPKHETELIPTKEQLLAKANNMYSRLKIRLKWLLKNPIVLSTPTTIQLSFPG